MKGMILGWLLLILIPNSSVVIDFGKEQGAYGWRIVNDDVMGGRSASSAYLTDNTLYFEGEVSLENNGGFASIRAPYGKYDLSSFQEVVIRARGTSRDFALSFDTNRAWYRPNYKVNFTPSEDWREFRFQLNDLNEYSVGRPTGRTIDPDKLEAVKRLGIILYDKQAGPFWLEVDFIRFQ